MNKAHAFIQTLAPHAQHATRKTGIPASVSLAQAILESGWGNSQLARRANNLFGIKAGSGWKGPTLSLPTKEFRGGRWVEEVAVWRAYPSYAEAFLDHARLFYNGCYETALAYRADPKKFLTHIAPVYATDPRYAEKVWNLVTQYGLFGHDLKPEAWALDPELVPERWYRQWHGLYGGER
jgi:flagellum-specific peptidoglycan hydrolase FlgJ